MQYVYALNPVCIVLIIPGHSRREVPRQAVDREVNPGIQWRIHRTGAMALLNMAASKLLNCCLGLFCSSLQRFRELQSIGITPWKMLLVTALALLITGCAQQTFTVQNKTGSSSTKRKPSPIISSFLELGRRKLSMQPKFVAAQKMLLKQKPSKHS